MPVRARRAPAGGGLPLPSLSPSLSLSRARTPPTHPADIVADLGTSYYQHNYLDKPGGLTMVDYLAHLVASVHSMRYADSLDASVYPGIPELALLVKSVDCFKEACAITRWAEGEPGLEDFPAAAPAVFDQRTGAPLAA